MGLLDAVLDVVNNQSADNAASTGAENNNMLGTILSLVNSPDLGGSLSGLIEKFSTGGLGEQVASWVSMGQNLPISGEQIQAVLGSSFVQSFAEKLGLDSDSAAGNLASLLPQVIDKLTPNGEVSNDNNLMELGMSALSGLMGNKSA